MHAYLSILINST